MLHHSSQIVHKYLTYIGVHIVITNQVQIAEQSSLTSTSHLVQIHASTTVISSKSRIEGITQEYHTPWFSPHPRQDEGSSYGTHDTSYHLQQEGINPEYENVLS